MNFHQPPFTFVGNVSLKVQDLKRSLSFYQDIIGLKILDQTEHTADLTADGKSILLTIEQPKAIIPKQEKTTGLYHFALLLPERSDLAEMVLHLIDKNVPIGSSDHLVSEAIYFSDPDRNGIEVYVDREPSNWSWHDGEVKMTVDPLNFKDLLSDNNHKEWIGLPSETVMGHIHLHVSDINKTETFYTKGLGFDVVSRFGNQALFISTGNYHHHIGLNTWNGVGAPPPPINSVGLESFSLVLPNEDNRQTILSNLTDLGTEIIEEKQSFLVVDPSGNRIYLTIE